MSYITLDTAFYTHPKVRALGNTQLARISRDLYVGALLYSRLHLTDGFVPLHALDDLDPITSHKDVNRAALALYSVGLFTKKRGRFTGYWIRDYEQFQQTKAEVEAAKAAAKERKRRQRERQSVPPVSLRDEHPSHGVTLPPVTPIEVETETEELKDLQACRDEDSAATAAARLFRAIRPEYCDAGTEKVVMAYALQLSPDDFDGVRRELLKRQESGECRNDGKYVNGALLKRAVGKAFPKAKEAA